MSTESFASVVSHARSGRRPGPGLVGAEFLKLRKRRGLVLTSSALTMLPMVIGYAVVTGKHVSNPERHGPGGGLENFVQSIGLLSGFAALAAILVGVTAGTGDLRAGVFRELVITGRSRIALFAARIPGGLGLVLPLAAASFLIAAVASIVLADGEPTPGLRLLVLSGAWIGLLAIATFALALGMSSVIGSTGPSIGLLLGWQAILAPLLLGMDELGAVRDLLPGTAVTALAPEALELQPAYSMSSAMIAVNLVLWFVLPLAAGAWRTNTREA
jgi:hypothetical protein